MSPAIKSLDAFTVIGLLYRGKNKNNEIPQLWGQLMPRYGEVLNKISPKVAYGVEDNYDEESGEFDYLAGYSVASDTKPPKGMVKWDIPAQTYAVFPCTLPTIRKAYSQAYQNWLPNSEYARASGPEFEFYDEFFSPNNSEAVMYLYIPVVKR
jgi:predicted transcriptional regulator YdeE